MKRSQALACITCAAVATRIPRVSAKPAFSDVLVQCSEVELTPDQMASSARNAVAINPMNAPDPGQERILANYKKLWGIQGKVFSVGFVDATPSDLRSKIIAYLNKWQPKNCASIPHVSFASTNDVASADVRISLEKSSFGAYWSFVARM